MLIELLLLPHCAFAEDARALLVRCLADAGLTTPVVERVGDYPSPTVLIDGVDVMTGAVTLPAVQACRLDRPTAQRVLAALQGRAVDAEDLP
jgi:hypothetical protein